MFFLHNIIRFCIFLLKLSSTYDENILLLIYSHYNLSIELEGSHSYLEEVNYTIDNIIYDYT